MIKAIIKRGHIDYAVTIWTRQATPQPFTHLILNGMRGRQFVAHVNPDATGLFVFGHPTLGVWDDLPAVAKNPEGGPMHVYSGHTQTEYVDEHGDPITLEAWEALPIVEIYLQGQIVRLGNGRRRDGVPFCGIAVRDGDTDLLDAIDAGVAWRSDSGDPWSGVSDLYKLASGQPRINPDSLTDLPEVRWPDAV